MTSETPVWHPAGELAEFARARKLVREIAGQSILFYRSGNEVLAVANRCSHLGQPLDQGRVIGGQIVCPLHGACFNLRTGAAVSGPAVSPLRIYRVRVEDGQVLVALSADDGQDG